MRKMASPYGTSKPVARWLPIPSRSTLMAASTSPSAPTECYTSSACSTDYLTALETGWRRRSHFVVCVAPKPGRPQKNDDLPHLRLTYRRIGEAYYRIDSPVRTKRNDACSGAPL